MFTEEGKYPHTVSITSFRCAQSQYAINKPYKRHEHSFAPCFPTTQCCSKNLSDKHRKVEVLLALHAARMCMRVAGRPPANYPFLPSAEASSIIHLISFSKWRILWCECRRSVRFVIFFLCRMSCISCHEEVLQTITGTLPLIPPPCL